MKKFGLIGQRLGHSFSQKNFTKKFMELGLTDHQYGLYELENIGFFPSLWEKDRDLVGLNVTVPYKESVIPFLTRLDSSAEKVGAVNTIKKEGQELVGYNSDYYGFKVSLEHFFQGQRMARRALILGSGGASKAVEATLRDLSIGYNIVSRDASKGDYTYDELNDNRSVVDSTDLIVNTTPVGMHPKVECSPEIPFDMLGPSHAIYDLVYNPEETKLMTEASKKGARVKNGLEMLYLQAERSWEIWNS